MSRLECACFVGSRIQVARVRVEGYLCTVSFLCASPKICLYRGSMSARLPLIVMFMLSTSIPSHQDIQPLPTHAPPSVCVSMLSGSQCGGLSCRLGDLDVSVDVIVFGVGGWV